MDSTSESIKARTATGFVFEQATADDLRRALQHAFSIWKKPRAWSMIRTDAMEQDFSWRKAAEQYRTLYERL